MSSTSRAEILDVEFVRTMVVNATWWSDPATDEHHFALDVAHRQDEDADFHEAVDDAVSSDLGDKHDEIWIGVTEGSPLMMSGPITAAKDGDPDTATVPVLPAADELGDRVLQLRLPWPQPVMTTRYMAANGDRFRIAFGAEPALCVVLDDETIIAMSHDGELAAIDARLEGIDAVAQDPFAEVDEAEATRVEDQQQHERLAAINALAAAAEALLTRLDEGLEAPLILDVVAPSPDAWTRRIAPIPPDVPGAPALQLVFTRDDDISISIGVHLDPPSVPMPNAEPGTVLVNGAPVQTRMSQLVRGDGIEWTQIIGELSGVWFFIELQQLRADDLELQTVDSAERFDEATRASIAQTLAWAELESQAGDADSLTDDERDAALAIEDWCDAMRSLDVIAIAARTYPEVLERAGGLDQWLAAAAERLREHVPHIAALDEHMRIDSDRGTALRRYQLDVVGPSDANDPGMGASLLDAPVAMTDADEADEWNMIIAQRTDDGLWFIVNDLLKLLS